MPLVLERKSKDALLRTGSPKARWSRGEKTTTSSSFLCTGKAVEKHPSAGSSTGFLLFYASHLRDPKTGVF